jgi:hypothetical protein
MFATKPMFSSDVKVVRTYEGKKGKQLSWDIVDISLSLSLSLSHTHTHTHIYIYIYIYILILRHAQREEILLPKTNAKAVNPPFLLLMTATGLRDL